MLGLVLYSFIQPVHVEYFFFTSVNLASVQFHSDELNGHDANIKVSDILYRTPKCRFITNIVWISQADGTNTVSITSSISKH